MSHTGLAHRKTMLLLRKKPTRQKFLERKFGQRMEDWMHFYPKALTFSKKKEAKQNVARFGK